MHRFTAGDDYLQCQFVYNKNQSFFGKSQNVIVKNRGILKQIVAMKSKKLNSAILAGFPCSHRKYIWFYDSGVSSLQISIIVTSTEKLHYLLLCQHSFYPCNKCFFCDILTGVIQ